MESDDYRTLVDDATSARCERLGGPHGHDDVVNGLAGRGGVGFVADQRFVGDTGGDPSTVLALTPMEMKVAQLVTKGLSNKEVGAQCWVSPGTVAFHLRNVFSKTGVTSRGALAQLNLR